MITGSAGFIGFHLANFFLKKNCIVLGIDNLNNSYDVKIKKQRISILKKNKNFFFYKKDIKNVNKLNIKKKIDCIIHLAAEAGVRKSLKNPYLYHNF